MSNQRVNLQAFNKEKLIFLVAAAGFAWGLYSFLSTGPIPLEAGAPISQEKKPVPPQQLALENLQLIDFYVADGKLTRMLDPRTNQPVNRERKSPFQPAADYLNAQNKPVPGTQPVPTPPPPIDTPKVAEEKKDDKFGKDFEAEVEFMGVVIKNGDKYALLRPKDGSSPRRVRIGDKIEEFDYTVTKIERQEVWVIDADKRPFILKDREEDAGSGSDEEETDIGDDAEMKPAKKEKKESKKPEPKPKAEAKPKPEKTVAQPANNEPKPNTGQAQVQPNNAEEEPRERTRRRRR